jgi:E3 ubiquitin-protein ligase SspH2
MSYGSDTDELMRRIQTSLTIGTLNIAGLNIHSLPLLPDKLKVLICFNTCLTSLPPLPDGLQGLYCYQTQITSLPPLPDELQILCCDNTEITSFPPLPSGLQMLWCPSTQITSLPLLPDGLQILNCVNTQLTQQNTDETMEEYISRIRLWQLEEASRERIQERTLELKEELVAAVWHPRRVWRLIELCGEDFDFEML